MNLIEALENGLLSLSRMRIPASLESFANPEFKKAQARILIVRLSSAKDVDRSTPHLFLFGECRRAFSDAYLDFAFFPTSRDRVLLDKECLPWFYGLASGEPPEAFDLVLISNSYSLELFNLPYLFTKSAIPLRSSARRSLGMESPIFILGGSNAGCCGALVDEHGDSFVDGIFFGEAEGYGKSGISGENAAILPKLVETLLPSLSNKVSAGNTPPDTLSGRLRDATQTSGFFATGIPLKGQLRVKVRRTRTPVRPNGAEPFLNNDQASTSRVQITYGCPAFCSFCFESWDRRPYRELSSRDICKRALRERIMRGTDSLEVYSFNFNTHTDIATLMLDLNRIFPNVDFLSQRTDILATTSGMLEAEHAVKKRSFTVGIEGVSSRMRAFYRKTVTNREIDAVMGSLLSGKAREIKLFYILSGKETDDDLQEFSRFLDALLIKKNTFESGTRIIFSFARLVRMPGTPLEFDSFSLDEKFWKTLISAYKALVNNNGLEWRLSQTFDDFRADQVLVLSDGRLMDSLHITAQKGHVFDSTLSKGAWKTLEANARSMGLLTQAFFEAKTPSSHLTLPFLDRTIDISTRYRFFQEAVANTDMGYCLGEKCLVCGACDDDERAFLCGHSIESPSRALLDSLEKLMTQKKRMKVLRYRIRIPESLCGATTPFLQAWLLRQIFASSRESAAVILGTREMLFSTAGFFGIALPVFSGWSDFTFSCTETISARSFIQNALSGLDAREVSGEVPERLSLRIQMPQTDSGEERVRDFLKNSQIACIERVLEKGARLWEASSVEKRKKTMYRLETSADTAHFSIHAELCPKAPIEALLKTFNVLSSPMTAQIVIEEIMP